MDCTQNTSIFVCIYCLKLTLLSKLNGTVAKFVDIDYYQWYYAKIVRSAKTSGIR